MRNFAPGALILATLLGSASAFAQNEPPPSGECTGNSNDPACGAPEQSGGGGCGCGGGSILINFTDQGDSYQYADDFDDDGFEDNSDNCPFAFNADQLDGDADGFGDACDLCARAFDTEQRDADGDGIGDACDDDADGDGFGNGEDNCPGVINPFLATSGAQLDFDDDGTGDACDDDDDNDGCLDAVDNCPLRAESECIRTGAIVANECFPDVDADGIADALDLCPQVPDVEQGDADGDGIGDACDADLDNDGIDNSIDNCAQVPNAEQGNVDKDGLGDACDARVCFVVDGDEQGCLDPAAPFAVQAAIPPPVRSAGVVTAQPVDLVLFANRSQKAIRYTWTVVEQPTDGNASITFPKGAVSYSDAIQYAYEADRPVRFTAMVPGSYTLELLAELAFDDDQGYDVKTSKSRVTIEVGGDAQVGCASSSAAPWSMLALPALALVWRRRRR